jgi:very-short-patch-repair endonuclease
VHPTNPDRPRSPTGFAGEEIQLSMYTIFNKAKLLHRRKELRKKQTPEEYKLWFFLRNKNLNVKFRRQHGIGSYIVDFYCREKNLVIELDGFQHLQAKDYDKERDLYLDTLGLKVLRFWNYEINTNIENVLMRIRLELE